MPGIGDLTKSAQGIEHPFPLRGDFKSYVHDISNAVLFSLERRHLEYLDLRHVPAPQRLEPVAPGDLFFMHMTQVGHGAAVERSLDVLNMQNILGSFRGGSHSLIVGLSADSAQTHLYMGARALKLREQGGTAAFDFVQNLRRTVEGNLPGTRFQPYSRDGQKITCPADEVMTNITGPLQQYPYLAALTGIPSLRGERDQQFAQSLDRFIQALQGQRYLMLIIAEPLEDGHVNDVLSDCLRMNSDVHSWVRVNLGRSLSTGDSDSRTEGRSTSDGGSDSETHGTTQGKGASKQSGALVGGLLGAGLSMMLSPMIGAATIAISSMASSAVTGMRGSVSDNISDNESSSRSRTWSEAVNESLTRSTTRNDSSSMNVEYLNKTAEYCEKIIDGYVRRLQRGKNLGMWNVGVYFLAEEPSTFAQGQAQLRSLYSGSDTYHEPMRTMDLSHRFVRGSVGSILSTFSNPLFDLQDSSTGEALRHPLGKIQRGLSTPLSTEELALLMNLPRREVPGLKLELVADFGVNPNPFDAKKAILLGKVVSGGMPLDIPVGIETQDLTRHIFVTGITGGGKTNTCFSLLKNVTRRGCPFLVIEPAKGEYRDLLGDPDVPDLRVYTLGDETVSPFRINPFQFVPGMNLITHLDNLKAIFNASFPMYASMPYLLEEAVVSCYEDAGWDLIYSTNKHLDMPAVVEGWKRGERDYGYTQYLPTLSDLMRKIDEVVQSKGYAQEVSSNFAAALKARISSLLLGSKGRMLNTRAGLPFETLFGSSTVLELRGVGDDDEKCFLMALILVQLYEYREQLHRWSPESGLRHLTVIEESHRLLGRAGGPVGASEVANPRGKAVDAFANMLAEIREYGEGFLIVDQTPSKLIPDVVKNTSTKIMHRLTARDDRDAMGDAMAMTEEQKQMVPRLRVGDAIFQTQDQDKPIWVKIPPCKGGGFERVSDERLRVHMAAEREMRNNLELADSLKQAQSRVFDKIKDMNTRLTADGARHADQRGAPSAAETVPSPRVDGLHIRWECTLGREEARNGCEKELMAGGRPVRLSIPPDRVPGQELVYKGLGMPGPDGSRRGDLIVRLAISD